MCVPPFLRALPLMRMALLLGLVIQCCVQVVANGVQFVGLFLRCLVFVVQPILVFDELLDFLL